MNRTQGLKIFSLALSQLSYRGSCWLGQKYQNTRYLHTHSLNIISFPPILGHTFLLYEVLWHSQRYSSTMQFGSRYNMLVTKKKKALPSLLTQLCDLTMQRFSIFRSFLWCESVSVAGRNTIISVATVLYMLCNEIAPPLLDKSASRFLFFEFSYVHLNNTIFLTLSLALRTWSMSLRLIAFSISIHVQRVDHSAA